jgi:hypothetical protein
MIYTKKRAAGTTKLPVAVRRKERAARTGGRRSVLRPQTDGVGPVLIQKPHSSARTTRRQIEKLDGR